MFAQLRNDEGAKALIRDLNDHDTPDKWINCLPGELEHLDNISCKRDDAYWEVVNIHLSFTRVRSSCLPIDSCRKDRETHARCSVSISVSLPSTTGIVPFG